MSQYKNIYFNPRSLKEQLPGNPDGPGGPGGPGMPLLPPKQFTQVSPFSPETAAKAVVMFFFILNVITALVCISRILDMNLDI